jgi:hypothetical protein
MRVREHRVYGEHMRAAFCIHGVLLAVSAASGCGGGPDSGLGSDTDTVVAAPIDVFGIVSSDVVQTDTGGYEIVPAADVQVCLLDASVPCDTTDSSGAYLLRDVAANADIALLFTKEGTLSVAYAIKTGDADIELHHGSSEGELASMGEVAATAGFIWPLADTSILYGSTSAGVFGYSAGVDGSTATLSPAAGKGPVYFAESGWPDPALTETTTHGQFLFGDLPAGEYVVSVGHDGRACNLSSLGWPVADDPSSVRLPAVPNFVVRWASFDCEL